MTSSPEPNKRQPRNLWLLARTYMFAKHEHILNEILSAISGLDLEYLPRTLLGIQGLTKADAVLLKLHHPFLRFIEDNRGNCLLEDQRVFQDVEETVHSIGSHLAFERLIIAELALRNTETFKILERRIAERPDVFIAGLQLLKGQACLQKSHTIKDGVR